MQDLHALRQSQGVFSKVPSLHGAREEWLLDHQIRDLSPLSVTWYRRMTEPLLSLCDPTADVTSLRVEDLRRQLADARARGASAATIHAEFRAVRGFVRWCLREQGWPMDVRLVLMRAPVKVEARLEIYTSNELLRLEQHWEGSVRDTALFATFLGTGVRLAEFQALTLSSREGEYIKVAGKGRKERILPLSFKVQRAWLRYVERERGRQPGPLFRLTRSGIRQVFRRAMVATGIHVHPHKFRHTFATLTVRKMHKEGRYDPETLRLLMGHTSYALFPRYLHLAKEDLLEGWEKISPY